MLASLLLASLLLASFLLASHGAARAEARALRLPFRADTIEPPGTWTRHGVVLKPTEPWEVDSNGHGVAAEPSVMHDGGVWKMWYTTRSGIGYATSSSPLGPWAKHSGVVAGGSEATVIKVGSVFYMVSVDPADYQRCVSCRTSTDGVTWGGLVKLFDAGADPADWDYQCANPFPYRAPDGTWYMFYEGWSNDGSRGGIGLATAPAITGPWSKPIGTPVLDSFSGAFMGYRAPFVARIDGWYYLWFHGGIGMGDDIYRARSADLYDWTFDSIRPLLSRTGSDEGEGLSVSQVADPCLATDGTQYVLFYTADTNYDYTQGAMVLKVATSPFTNGVKVIDERYATMPTLSAPTCPKAVARGRWFKVYGGLKPRFAAKARTVKVTVYRFADARWRACSSFRAVNADCGACTRYAARTRITRAGKYRFRATTAATATWAAATSGFSRTLTIR